MAKSPYCDIVCGFSGGFLDACLALETDVVRPPMVSMALVLSSSSGPSSGPESSSNIVFRLAGRGRVLI